MLPAFVVDPAQAALADEHLPVHLLQNKHTKNVNTQQDRLYTQQDAINTTGGLQA